MARELHRARSRPAGRARHLGHAPAATRPGAMYRNIDVIGADRTTSAGTSTPYASRGAARARDPRAASRALRRVVPGQGRSSSPSSAPRPTAATRTARPGGYGFQARAARDAPAHATRRSRSSSGDAHLEPARLRRHAAVRRRLDQRASCRTSGSCAASTRRACSPTAAARSRRPPWSRGVRARLSRRDVPPRLSRCCPRRSCAGRSPRRRVFASTPCSSATSRSVPPGLGGLLDDLGGLVVADVRVQRGGRRRASTSARALACPPRLASMPSTHFSANATRRRRQQVDRLQQVARDQRDAHVELELALHAADRDRGVVADHLRGDLQHDLRDHRVDLARHDRRALLQLGQEDLADAGARAGAHQREVVGDLGQRDGDDLQRARQLDERVAVALRLERVGGRRDLSGFGLAAAAARARAAANFGCVFRPVPVAVPPSGIWRDVRRAPPRRARCAERGSARRSRRTPGRA